MAVSRIGLYRYTLTTSQYPLIRDNIRQEERQRYYTVLARLYIKVFFISIMYKTEIRGIANI